MEIKVSLNNLRVAPRKTRQLVDVVRNKSVAEARALLEFTVKRAADPVLKLLNSAVASALHDFKLDESKLYICKITVDEGPKLKRSHPMSRGRAYPIMKRTSHINLTISDTKKGEEKAAKKEVTAKTEAVEVTPKKPRATKKSVKKEVK